MVKWRNYAHCIFILLCIWSFIAAWCFVTVVKRTMADSRPKSPYSCVVLEREDVRRRIPGYQFESANSSSVTNRTVPQPPISPDNLCGDIVMRRLKYLKEPIFEECFVASQIKWSNMIFVKSAAGNTARREWIRRTWGSIKYLEGIRFDTVFVVGRPEGVTKALVEEEYERNHDMLLLDEPDNYRNISLKTLASMQWASENLPDDYFYTSADDDFLVYMDRVRDAIEQYEEKMAEAKWPEFPIVCMYALAAESRPIRDPDSKYYVSKETYRWPNWPKFCLGGMYTTSVSVARQLLDQAKTAKRIEMDDVWVTGILRQGLGMPNEMVVDLKDAPAAEHMYGFAGRQTDSVRAFMQREWGKVYKNLRFKTVCAC
ncbi:beta-1,3-galactosyltransferase 5-like [Clavelina lepadiformis]|uniref:Hexosyltransferase n=1 Tax=Clavelina lepadiformis TaxID=159417 RepID=A0ABP0GMT5_CLALP